MAVPQATENDRDDGTFRFEDLDKRGTNHMAYDHHADPRIDPRVKMALDFIPPEETIDFATRDEALAEANTDERLAAAAFIREVLEACDDESIVSSKGLRVELRSIVSQPDGNSINLQVIRPDNEELLPCVYYIHGGGMATGTALWGNYRAFGKMIAHHGVVVVMVDFRNSLQPSSVPELAPFPGGLNDCLSGLRWTHEHADELGVNPSSVVVAGESGGGNLTLATGLALKRSGEINLVKGLYAFAPYVLGEYPDPDLPSTVENNGIFINLNGNAMVIAYGAEHHDNRDPLAWPYFASEDDLAGLPPVIISVNECDPLRDEGIAMYRRLLAAGVDARGRVILGTMHATEAIPNIHPDLSRDAAQHLAGFVKG
jgi:acetyl esterase/lipase